MVDDFRAALRTAKVGYSDIGIKGHAAVVKLLDRPCKIDTVAPALEAAPRIPILRSPPTGWSPLTSTMWQSRPWSAPPWTNSIEVVRRRVDDTGTVEPTIQRQGSDRILLELPGIQDPEQVKALLGKTAKMTFRFVDRDVTPEQSRRAPCRPTDDLLPLANAPGRREAGLRRAEARHGQRRKSDDAQRDAGPATASGWSTSRFDSTGGKRFCEATEANVGKPFAIVLDNKVISAPVIREPICGGSGQISGNFTAQIRQRAAVLLRTGALPAPAQDHRGTHGRPRSRRRFDQGRRLCLRSSASCW